MDLDEIIKTLSTEGSVIAIKTDTVYGLVCNAFDKIATKKIYEIKNRETEKPLSIFVKDISDAKKYVDFRNDDKVIDIMNTYWPGALTIILNKRNDLLNHILAGNDCIGLRIPDDKDLLYILNNVDFPLAQTSCNISGEKEYTNATQIKERLGGKIDLIVDGGEIKDSIASTVIKVDDDGIKVLRTGALKVDV